MATQIREAVTIVASATTSTFECDPENNRDDETVRIFRLTEGDVPALSDVGLALLALPKGSTVVVWFARRG